MVYVPATAVFTVPLEETVSPPLAVAPASVQEPPRSTVSVPEVTVITGAVVSPTVVLTKEPATPPTVRVVVVLVPLLVEEVCLNLKVSPLVAVMPLTVEYAA